jgi:hypothetical protein
MAKTLMLSQVTLISNQSAHSLAHERHIVFLLEHAAEIAEAFSDGSTPTRLEHIYRRVAIVTIVIIIINTTVSCLCLGVLVMVAFASLAVGVTWPVAAKHIPQQLLLQPPQLLALPSL